MKTILVTGASSRMGQAVVRGLVGEARLLLLQHRTTVPVPARALPAAEVLDGGLESAARHAARIATADIVVHLAGATHARRGQDYFRVNLAGTQALIGAVRRDAHFLYMSTRCLGAVAGPYGESKARAEEAIRASGLGHTILRPAEVYGSNPREGIDRLLRLACERRVLLDFRSQPAVTYSPVALEELVQLLLAVVRRDQPLDRAYTVSNHGECTAPAMASALSERLGRRVRCLPVPVAALRLVSSLGLPLPFTRDQVQRLVAPKSSDHSQARADFGFAPRPFLEVLRGPGVLCP